MLDSSWANQNIITLEDPEADVEIRPDVTTLIVETSDTQFKSHRLERFSHWMTLCRTIASLIQVATSFKKISDRAKCYGWKCYSKASTISEISHTKVVIVLTVQRGIFREEYKCLETNQTLPKQNPLKKLIPIIDEGGLLRVGGHLANASVTK